MKQVLFLKTAISAPHATHPSHWSKYLPNSPAIVRRLNGDVGKAPAHSYGSRPGDRSNLQSDEASYRMRHSAPAGADHANSQVMHY
ncbi:hypothetical protein JOF57_005872 [Mycolicibacterium lutetiense]|uniref:Uncharacterized protein n=1 Tax=Mycolicibacterium lutetiense TaxID=1641992 RepID=A0ABS5A2H5_9MYCO|nr:hypothetical protein [Mycolicibacterium lutetiense]